MPAMGLLEFAADKCFVTVRGDFVAVGDRVNVHTGVGQFRSEAAIICVPEQRCRSNQR